MEPDYTSQSVLNKVRLDKFDLVLNLPKAFKSITTKSSRVQELVNLGYLQFSIYGAPVPAISVPAVEMPYAGQILHISSHARPAYPPLTVNFAIDNLFTNWWVLWKWLDLLNSARDSIYNAPVGAVPTSKVIGTLGDYATTITVFGLNEFNKRIIQFNYYGAFVTELSEITYNYRSTDEANSTFTLEYAQFDSELLNY